jgi:hypothetical protein
VDVEGADHRGPLDEVSEDLVQLWKLLPAVAFSILFRFPKANSYNAIRLRLGRKYRLVQEPRLLPEKRQDLLVDRICNFGRFSRFGRDFNDSCEHGEVLLSWVAD